MWAFDDGTSTITDCKCRKLNKLKKLNDFANIPKEFSSDTITSFNLDLYRTKEAREVASLAKRAAVNFVKDFDDFAAKGKGLYFYSKTKGSGKSRLAVSIGNALIKTKNISVKFTTTIELIQEIQSTFNKNTKYNTSDLLNAMKSVDVLILDDIGIERQQDWITEIIYSILDYRLTNRKITIFTSNVKVEELKHDDRIRSRIVKMAMPLSFPEESVRSSLAKSENEELQAILFK